MADYRKIRAQEYKSWLGSLPEEIYDLSDTSHMVRLLDAMCGEGGVGAARKSLFLKRLQTSLPETRGTDLDTVYSKLFNLRRLDSEQHEYDLSSLLTFEQQQEINVKDAHYRARIAKYMRALQNGATKEGIRLAVEAALNEECQIIASHEYYQSMGMANGDETSQSVAYKPRADYNEYVVVVMRDEPLTDQERYNAYEVAKRLKPVDAELTLKTKGEVVDDLVLTENDDIYYPVKPVDTSSDWWGITRFVTGRPDWDYSKYPHGWIEPNKSKEAPRQFQMNSQEETNDFTFMVKSVKASSEHIGYYNQEQQELFDTLSGQDSIVLMEAKNAMSSSSSRKYTAGFYGTDSVIDWSYPTQYLAEMSSYFLESSRSSRFWSSNEKEYGSEPEWIEIEMKRIVPMNRLLLNLSRKPVKVTPYLSSAVDDEGNHIWRRIYNKEGLALSFTQRSWGGTYMAGEVNTVEFNFMTAEADAIRFEFERLDVPYYKTKADGAYEEKKFPYSIEVSEVSVHYDLMSAADYRRTSYEDPFGNRVDPVLNVMSMEGLTDGDPDTYWLSQPNIGENAVEYVILDLRQNGEATRINFLELETIYDGCQMNLYSTDEEEPCVWVPYPGVYELGSGRLEIPSRMVSFLKMEFTSLCAIPYKILMSGIEVMTRQFPIEERRLTEENTTETYETTEAENLLAAPQDSLADASNIYAELGIQDIYQEYEYLNSKAIDQTEPVSLSLLQTSDIYRYSHETTLSSIYGENMAVERSLEGSRLQASSLRQVRMFYRFHEIGEHRYEEKSYERTMDLAYVVGMKSVKAGFSCRIMAVTPNQTFILPMADRRFIDENVGWDIERDERVRVSTDEQLCVLETIDLQSMVHFKTFEFAVNQNPPREVFQHPSHMIQEWHGLNSTVEDSEFGVSGEVLKATLLPSGASGIESENKLIRSKAIAEAQVEIFPPYDGEWVFECQDLFGENLFSMKYDVQGGKWTTLGVVFTPQPGGLWWNDDYNYRVRVPLTGAIARGQHIFVPNINFDDLALAGICADDFKDLRLIYFNGIDCYELNCDITDNMELWFECQQSLNNGVAADGRYHFDEGAFIGAYYFYFGRRLEDREPERNYHEIFTCNKYENLGTQYTRGIRFTKPGEMVSISGLDYRISSVTGFISMEVTPTNNLPRVPEGQIGMAETRYLFDYEDEEMKLQIYTYEEQLTFVIVDSDGYESAFVSKYDPDKPLFKMGRPSRLLVQWGDRGSEIVYRNGEPDGDDRNRRAMVVMVDSAEPLECIDNVYDEKHYNGGKY